MSTKVFARRRFLTLALAGALWPTRVVLAQAPTRRGSYVVDVGIMYNMMTFRLAGTIEEQIDRGRGRYEVRFVGEGARIANRVESEGLFRSGRWMPSRATSVFQVAGRESRSEIAYDYGRRTIEYHYRGETFFLRRARVADDVVSIPEGARIDDVISATLNYADGQWPAERDGSFQTSVIRRRRRDDEGPDDVESQYRAELVPFILKVTTAPDTKRSEAVFDLTRFSSWALNDRPARVVFGPSRRPETITCSLMLGTSVTIHLNQAA